ncbi:FAS1-like dehydratase domain-containing protein [Neobacillus rhizophilus]|uniref:MaoC family dehydratase N-terminal domain-containing protein n=1 Tax=Neobacillus rhizophilus TaxID=2833579 RepID=A0A942U193_9BACI|nr:MaoC family dehydratase N-terminal domain-containing protein [Neobacillus rhizophilus]MBS4211400.1 MaoC family dehydratase N-terminal domain-containing protein [Neobacillus rhizophilus]
MATQLEEKIGMKLESYTFRVEKGKIRELALAIGDLKDEYLKGESLPPTFPTVIEFWGGKGSSANLLGLNVKKVLHGEQTYEYLKEIKPEDEITVHSVVEDAYTKAKMNFVIIKKEFFNQQGELVLLCRQTVIERH